MALDRRFWRGRRVFVTGHTGFKGAWLLAMLRALDAEPSCFALDPPTDPSLFALLGLAGGRGDRRGDVRDAGVLASAVAAAEPEIVIHMAAQPLVRASYRDPAATYAVNVMGTVHLLEACRAAPRLRAVIVVTTDKCYEHGAREGGCREGDRLGGADPYSSSKACAELVVDAYRSSYFAAAGIGLASARAGNVIGGGDFAPDRLVPDAARAFAACAPLRIRNPRAVRPWQHVLDPLAGYLLLAERLHGDARFAAGWNFGPSPDDRTVGEVADRLAALWGEGARWEQDVADHPHEAARLTLDSTKARVELGWTPRLDLDEALAQTLRWYRAFADGDDMRALTGGQVAGYLQAAGR